MVFVGLYRKNELKAAPRVPDFTTGPHVLHAL